MSKAHEIHGQLSLPSVEEVNVANGMIQEAQPAQKLEPRDEFDRLHDQFNAVEIAGMLGEEVPQAVGSVASPAVVTRPKSVRKKPIDRRTLSARGKLLADTTKYSDRQNEWRRQ